MVDRVFNRNPTPGRVHSFLPAVWSAHISMCAIQVMLLALASPLPFCSSQLRIFTYFQAVVTIFLISVEGPTLCLPNVVCGVECNGLLVVTECHGGHSFCLTESVTVPKKSLMLTFNGDTVTVHQSRYFKSLPTKILFSVVLIVNIRPLTHCDIHFSGEFRKRREFRS